VLLVDFGHRRTDVGGNADLKRLASALNQEKRARKSTGQEGDHGENRRLSFAGCHGILTFFWISFDH
jgi:hypothetical protein